MKLEASAEVQPNEDCRNVADDGDDDRGRPIWLEVMNPDDATWPVVLIRLSVIGAVFVGLLALGFKSVSNDIMWAVGLASVLAPALLRLFVYVQERFLVRATGRRKAQGHYEMVAWLGFTFMVEYTYEGLVSLLGWSEADARLNEDIRSNAQVHDERANAVFDEDGRFFFDFVADTGDGFDSSYLVARMLGQESITVEERAPGAPPKTVSLPRARVVVHGGDICYPMFTWKNFHYRFAQPYTWAFPAAASRGEAMYLAAGNHEYLDGLIGYRKFLLPRQSMGGWALPQQGTYFAIRLPRDWILFVIDLGPEPEDIDDFQREWFDRIELGTNERIVMVYHVPEWIKNGALGYNAMPKLRAWRKRLGDRVRAVLAGDLHFYRRMEEVAVEDEDRAYEMQPDQRRGASKVEASEDTEAQLQALSFAFGGTPARQAGALRVNCVATSARQYYVAGHGGAFNHATHFPRVDRLPLFSRPGRAVETRCDFPTPSVSKARWDETWLFMFWRTSNHVYLRFIAATYMCMFLGVYPGALAGTDLKPGNIMAASLRTAVQSGFFYPPLILIFIMSHVMATANYDLTTVSENLCARLLALLHTGLQVSAGLLARSLLDVLFIYVLGTAQLTWGGTFAYCLVANFAMYIFGYLVGGLLTAVYYAMAVTWFSWHYNEALSLIQIEDFKGFLRIGIQESGDLDIFTIVADKTPKSWAEQTEDETKARFVSPEVAPYLLEKVTLSHNP